MRTCLQHFENTRMHEYFHSLIFYFFAVSIYPIDQKSTFRGFFLQARDANSNEWIGEWIQSENTKTIPECSAITHSDNRDKLGAKLFWKAPQNKRGRVYFT